MLKHKLPRFLFSSSPHVYNSTENPSKVYSSSYDSIIIGAGHNGLICGNYLAKSGQKVFKVF